MHVWSQRIIAYFATRPVDQSERRILLKNKSATFLENFFLGFSVAFYTFYSLKNCLLKVQDLYYEISTNDADIFRIVRPQVFCKTDVLKDVQQLYHKRDSKGVKFLKTSVFQNNCEWLLLGLKTFHVDFQKCISKQFLMRNETTRKENLCVILKISQYSQENTCVRVSFY